MLCAVAVFFLILTASIGLPIYFRPFYYAHMQLLDLPKISGYSAEQIMDAYNEVLDYLTLPGKPFGTGSLPWSESGKAHFEDCKVLFDLNASVLLGSAVCVLALVILERKGRVAPLRLGNHSAFFWAAVSALILPVVVGGLAALDFDRAFVIFHSIFFPGKDNWLFDWYEDQIIRILPQQFFMDCAILIGMGILLFSLGIIVWEYRGNKNKKRSIHNDYQA